MTICLAWTLEGLDADLVVDAGYIERGTGLEEAVLISLFTDERCDEGVEHPGAEHDLRGWWGDRYMERPLGSKLWLLGREKLTPELLPRIEAEAKAALQWMIDDGLASEIEVTAEIYDSKSIGLLTKIYRPGDSGEAFERLWRVYFGLE